MDYEDRLSRALEKRVRIDDDGDAGLGQTGELCEIAAYQAAACLVFYWDIQMGGMDKAIIHEDVENCVRHLRRWETNLLAHPELFE